MPSQPTLFSEGPEALYSSMWYKAYQDGEPYPGAVGVTTLSAQIRNQRVVRLAVSVWRGWLSGDATIFAENLPDSQKNLRLHPVS